MPGTPRTLDQAIRFRADEQDRNRQSRMVRVVVECAIKVAGSGEVSTPVVFPVVFAEKPVPSFGHELDVNQSPEATNFPVCSVTVLSWKTRDMSEQRTFYTGAQLGIVTLGRERMRSIVHVTFRGLAFRDPTVGVVGLNETI